jgi:putative DNA primase/helicase
MKSPVIDKVVAPLRKIDDAHYATWQGLKALAAQAKSANSTKVKPSPQPAKPARCIIEDATPEKVAEILSRDPAGALMVHDELASLFGSFERYSSGASARAFYLTSWNGGPSLKDRVGKGASDDTAEIRVENLALSQLAGIQPDRLAKLRDLTSDGLLQRFLPVLMRAPKRGNERHAVSAVEVSYA